MDKVRIIFPHQLHQDLNLYDQDEHIWLIEEYLFFKLYNFHKQKLAFHRASMKVFEAELRTHGYEVRYIEAHEPQADARNIGEQLAELKVKKVSFFDPTDDWLLERLTSSLNEAEVDFTVEDSPCFMNSPKELTSFFKPEKKSFFQTTFYKQQRVKHNILVDSQQQPDGGKWTFDSENRKPYPKSKTPPSIQFPSNNEYWKEAVAYVETHFSQNLGQVSSHSIYPFSRKQALKWLHEFIESRLAEFGHYEDAIVKEHTFLHHSVLSPLINVGLLSPQVVVREVLKAYKKEAAPLNSVEGIVRQIIGWREFIRGMYLTKGRVSRSTNYWGFKRSIPSSFYDGTTGIPPIDITIKKVLQTGYCHHIERLMVLGNFMLLCEFAPDEVYQWFMELFIDSYDWVMVPNVYGMSQFADGGFFATKPYISGSNYLMKMGNYQKGPWQEIWDALFWRFMDVNRDFFLKNPRLAMLVRTYDKWDVDKRKRIHATADEYLEKLDLSLTQ